MSMQLRPQPAVRAAGQHSWPRAGEVFRMAFWGVCGALAVFAAVMIQKAPQVRAEAEQQLAAEIAVENRAYCEKWRMPAGTREHAICTLDLDEIRARDVKRRATAMDGLL